MSDLDGLLKLIPIGVIAKKQDVASAAAKNNPDKNVTASSSRKFCRSSHRSSFRGSAPSFLARSRHPPRRTLTLFRVAALAGSSVGCSAVPAVPAVKTFSAAPSAAESAKAPRRLADTPDPQRQPGTPPLP